MQFARTPQILSASDGLTYFFYCAPPCEKKTMGFLDTNGNHHTMVAVEASWSPVEICPAFLPEDGAHPLPRQDHQKGWADRLLALRSELISTRLLSLRIPRPACRSFASGSLGFKALCGGNSAKATIVNTLQR